MTDHESSSPWDPDHHIPEDATAADHGRSIELQPITARALDEKDEKRIDAGGDAASPSGAAAAAAEDEDPEEAAERAEAARVRAAARLVFERPLVYYKRNTPYLRPRRRSRGPTEIVWPDKSISLGVPPEKTIGRNNTEAERRRQQDDENLVVFSSPGDDARRRRRNCMCMLIFFMLGDFTLITAMFAVNDSTDSIDALTYASTVIALLLGGVALWWSHLRLLNLFIIVMYIDSILGFLRMYSWAAFGQFLIQYFICWCSNTVKKTLEPHWFTPS